MTTAPLPEERAPARRVRALLAAASLRLRAFVAYVHRLDRFSLASWLGLVLLLVVAPLVALDSGITWDEKSQLEYGDKIVAWFRTAGADQSALNFLDLYLYGGLFDAPAQWIVSLHILPWAPYETRHVLTALVAVLGIIATWLMAARVRGPRAGFFAAVVLALTPAWSGHGMFNPKDIPFGAAAAFVSYVSVRIVLAAAPLSWADALRAGLAVGVALGVRAGGMFLLAYPVMAALGAVSLAALLQKRSAEPVQLVRPALIALCRLVCMLPLVWLAMISAWPWAQVDPLIRPLQAAASAQRFHWQHPVLFGGERVMSTDLPWTYLPTWFGISLPETYLLAAITGLVALGFALRARVIDPRRGLAVLMLLACVLLPYLGVLYSRPVLYDAQRHFLFLLPPLAAVAGLAFDAFLRVPALGRLRWVGALALALPAAITLADMASLHPYEYVYFNRVFGGLPAAFGRYETDYWGASYREGFAWVNTHVQRPPGKLIRIAACTQNHQLRYFRKHMPGAQGRFRIMDDYDAAEIFLSFTRNNCHQTFGKVIHIVERVGVPLLFVIERPPRKSS